MLVWLSPISEPPLMKAVREEEAIGGRPNTDALAIVVKARSAAAALESSCLKSALLGDAK